MHRLISEKQNRISDLCRRFNVGRLEVFGSAADANGGGFDEASSDADFLVEFLKPASLGPLDEYFGLRGELEALLGRAVDLVELSAIKNPYVRNSIERSRELVYAA